MKQKSSLIAKLTQNLETGEGVQLDFNIAGT
jgi:hypothetical protein